MKPFILARVYLNLEKQDINMDNDVTTCQNCWKELTSVTTEIFAAYFFNIYKHIVSQQGFFNFGTRQELA